MTKVDWWKDRFWTRKDLVKGYDEVNTRPIFNSGVQKGLGTARCLSWLNLHPYSGSMFCYLVAQTNGESPHACMLARHAAATMALSRLTEPPHEYHLKGLEARIACGPANTVRSSHQLRDADFVYAPSISSKDSSNPQSSTSNCIYCPTSWPRHLKFSISIPNHHSIS